MTAMDTILVVNAGSSSVKFLVYGVEGEGVPEKWHWRAGTAVQYERAPVLEPLEIPAFTPTRWVSRFSF